MCGPQKYIDGRTDGRRPEDEHAQCLARRREAQVSTKLPFPSSLPFYGRDIYSPLLSAGNHLQFEISPASAVLFLLLSLFSIFVLVLFFCRSAEKTFCFQNAKCLAFQVFFLRADGAWSIGKLAKGPCISSLLLLLLLSPLSNIHPFHFLRPERPRHDDEVDGHSGRLHPRASINRLEKRRRPKFTETRYSALPIRLNRMLGIRSTALKTYKTRRDVVRVLWVKASGGRATPVLQYRSALFLLGQ